MDKILFNNQVRYITNAIPEHQLIFNNLNNLPWHEIMWKTGRSLPRLCLHSVEVFPVGNMMRQWVELFFFETMNVGCKVMSIFGNHYRDGKDWLPDHRDSYDMNGMQLHVVSLSFGVTRTFRFAGMGPSFELSGGDMIMFSPAHNAISKHGIPKGTTINGSRINLTCFCLFQGDPYSSPFIRELIPKINS